MECIESVVVLPHTESPDLMASVQKREWVFEVSDDRKWISKNQMSKIKQWMKTQINEYEKECEKSPVDFEIFVEGRQYDLLHQLHFAKKEETYCRLDWDILQHPNLERWYWQIRFFVSPSIEKEKQQIEHKRNLLQKLRDRIQSQRQQQSLSCKYRMRR